MSTSQISEIESLIRKRESDGLIRGNGEASPTVAGNIQFPHSSEIIRRIESALKDRAVDEVSIAICQPGGSRRFSVDKSGAVAESSGEDKLYVPTTCMIKLHTATIAIERFAARGIDIDQSVDEMSRDLFGVSVDQFSGMTLRHLLNSSHGLDDISYDASPVASDGFLDFAAQVQRFTSVPMITDPGRAFSFGDVGMLLIGAFLEKLEGQKFADVVTTHLLSKLAAESGVPVRANAISGRCCPTTGGGLTSSATDLMNLARHYFVGGDAKNPEAPTLLATMKSNPASFAGWTGMGVSVGLGWHEYAGDWYGYNGDVTGGGSQLLRVLPEQGVVISVVSKKIPAHYLAISVFGEVLPESKLVRPPRLLTPDAAAACLAHPEDIVGTYEVGPLAAEIYQSTKSGFDVRITNRFANGTLIKAPIECKLRLTAERGFFTMPIESNFLAFGQIVDLEGTSGSRRYMWNGRRLWRKVGD